MNNLYTFEQTALGSAGAPDIVFRFDHAVCLAELAGARLYAELRGDPNAADRGGADVRLTAATGEVLADIVLNERAHRTLTENLMDVGSALLWSHWRYLEAKKLAQTNGDPAVAESVEVSP